MFVVEDTKDNLGRRVGETLAYVPKIGPYSAALAEALHREATMVEAALPGLNREGMIQASGFLHGLSFAAAVLLEERRSMARTK